MPTIKTFLVYAAFSTLVSVGAILLLYVVTDVFKVYYIHSIIIIESIGLFTHFMLNRKYNFKTTGKAFLSQLTSYVLISVFGSLIVISLTYILSEYAKILYIISYTLAGIITFFIRFYLHKNITYKIETNQNIKILKIEFGKTIKSKK